MHCFNIIVHNVVRINILLLLLLLLLLAHHSTVGDIKIINLFEITKPFGFDAPMSRVSQGFRRKGFFV